MALQGEVREVFRCAETTGDDQRVKIFGVRLAYVFHFATGNARGFNQHVARFRHLFAGQVIDDMVLSDVRCEALNLRTTLIQAKQGQNAFVNFGAIVDTAAGQDYSHFFLHRFGSLSVGNLGLLLICPTIDRFWGRVFSQSVKAVGVGRGLEALERGAA
ncbi:hypothetical protein ALP20_03456 [Pseudomonas coronafaciens pv. coronafaciens]|nr:hypothetical protein ALP20_03456 [Pseudomonas coronafaciens pv. coronafaciens]